MKTETKNYKYNGTTCYRLFISQDEKIADYLDDLDDFEAEKLKCL